MNNNHDRDAQTETLVKTTKPNLGDLNATSVVNKITLKGTVDMERLYSATHVEAMDINKSSADTTRMEAKKTVP